VFHHIASKLLKFPSTQNARFHQLTKMYTVFNRFESPLIIQFGIPCKNLSIKECVNLFQTSKIFRLLSEKWHDVNIRQP